MLADKFTDSIIDHLIPFDNYKPYPTCSDRTAWNSIDEKFKKAFIARAERMLSYEYQPLTAELIRYTGETDDLSKYYKLRRENNEALVSFVMAECIENKGRFMSSILDGVWGRLDEATWHYPCPTAMYKRFPAKIVDVTNPLIELGSSSYVYNLAIIYYLLKQKFDDLSIDVFKRLYYEVDRRIFTPYLEREDYWWMAFERQYHKKMGVLYSINNFTPHCVNNVIEAFLLLEQDDTRRAEAIQKTMKVLDNYLNYIANDGWCDEGNGYWFMSYGSLTLALEKMKTATSGYLDIFNNKKIYEMGQFLCNAHIGNGYFINFSDGHPINRLQNSKAISYALNTNNMGLLKMIFEISDSSAYEKLIIEKTIGFETALFIIFNIEKIRDKFGTIGLESNYIVKERYYSDSEVLIARESDNDYSGLYLAFKGGHNDENHNHNDAGNFIVYKNSNPILIDPGVEAYIADTFNTNRYKLWTMQSAYHNLPSFNGVM